MPIAFIDIFQPKENGLPDFSKISVGQIFNGSAAASLENLKIKHDVVDKPSTPAASWMVDPATGQGMEVRKANFVEQMLSGGLPDQRLSRQGGPVHRSSTGVPYAPLPTGAEDMPSNRGAAGSDNTKGGLFPPGGGPPPIPVPGDPPMLTRTPSGAPDYTLPDYVTKPDTTVGGESMLTPKPSGANLSTPLVEELRKLGLLK